MAKIKFQGLNKEEVTNNTERYGKNIIPEKEPVGILNFFLKQFKSPLIYILLVVAVITFFLKEYSDTIIITIVLIVNAIIGTIQEYKVNNTIKALRKLSRPRSKVLREGKIINVNTEDVTIDDIVFLESGDIVPADGTLIESYSIQINESQINGESFPILKDIEKNNYLFKSTIVTSGNGFMKVEKIGKETTIGALAFEIQKNIYNRTVLEKKVHNLSKKLLFILLITLVAFFIVGLFRKMGILELFEATVSLGVSAIPEGLPIVLTIVLSIGATRISRAKALLRNLPSGSTLASVSYICTDKTGTITYGDIRVKEIVPISQNKITKYEQDMYIQHSLDIKDFNGNINGDILDIKLGEYLQGRFSLTETKELPFSSENKFNAKEYKINDEYIQIYKGAPELFLSNNEKFNKYTEQGFRVIFVGYKKVSKKTEFNTKDVNPVALVVFEDKIREDVKQSIEECKETGIKILMITGDNMNTAIHVAKSVSIIEKETDICMTGQELDGYSDQEIKNKIKDIKIIARASPSHKERIIRILQSLNEVVAMTGDGVNDGPALSLADIGIAMGKTGTEVAREASDLILVNDSFSNIVFSIFEARTIIENIKKTIIFLISTSLGEIIIIAGSVFLGLPLPLLPVQILWLNLITDGFLDIAIATEKPESIYKKFNYKRYQEPLLNRYDVLRMMVMSSVMGITCLFVFASILKHLSLIIVRTTVLILMSIFQWFNAINVRKHFNSVFNYNIFSNKYINLALGIEVILLYLSISTKIGNTILQTEMVPRFLLVIAIVPAFLIIIGDEIYKKINIRKIFLSLTEEQNC